MVNQSIRLTHEQNERWLRTNDAAERVRKFIDTWDMKESPEQLKIEAEEKRREAQQLLTEYDDLMARYATLTTERDDDFESIREMYEYNRIGERSRDKQIGWLTSHEGWDKQRALEFLAHYGPGPEEGECD